MEHDRKHFDDAYRRLADGVGEILGEARRDGKYEYPHRPGWPYIVFVLGGFRTPRFFFCRTSMTSSSAWTPRCGCLPPNRISQFHFLSEESGPTTVEVDRGRRRTGFQSAHLDSCSLTTPPVRSTVAAPRLSPAAFECLQRSKRFPTEDGTRNVSPLCEVPTHSRRWQCDKRVTYRRHTLPR